MKMSKFPYIAESNQSKVPWLIYSESLAICLGCESHSYKEISNYDLVEFFSKNITADYLLNTYGKLESKEHAEFIVKLAEGAGFKVGLNYEGGKSYFNFYDETIVDFWNDEATSSANGEKLITLPLPPKDKSMQSQKEWPAVGDEVLINNLKCKVIGIDGDAYWIKRKKTGNYDIAKREQLKKPPTPEE